MKACLRRCVLLARVSASAGPGVSGCRCPTRRRPCDQTTASTCAFCTLIDSPGRPYKVWYCTRRQTGTKVLIGLRAKFVASGSSSGLKSLFFTATGWRYSKWYLRACSLPTFPICIYCIQPSPSPDGIWLAIFSKITWHWDTERGDGSKVVYRFRRLILYSTDG